MGNRFSVEDNCLVTEDGCENLSAITPRTIGEIEDTMQKGYFAADYGKDMEHI